MSGLFSHSPAPDDALTFRPDVEASVIVPAPSGHAWAGLTEHLHLWWPAALLSKWGESSFFDLEDNALVETSAEDDEYVWGEVVNGATAQRLELRWRHVGSISTTSIGLDLRAGSVESGIDSGEHESVPGAGEEPSSTLILTHRGWSTTESSELYTFYKDFWPEALARYRRFMGGS